MRMLQRAAAACHGQPGMSNHSLEGRVSLTFAYFGTGTVFAKERVVHGDTSGGEPGLC